MTYKLISLTTLTLLSLNAGCSHIIKRSLKEAKGENSQAAEVPGTLNNNFSDFKSVEVAPPVNRLGGLVPAEFVHTLQPALVRHLCIDESAPFPGANQADAPGPPLHVETDIMWYHDRGGGFAAVLGDDSFAIALFTLSQGGEEVARVQIVTKSGASRTEAPDMAAEMARGLARFIIRVRDGLSEEEQEDAEREREEQRESQRFDDDDAD